MENKNLNKLSICHLILMGIMCILSCVSAGIVFSGHIPEGFEIVSDTQKTASMIAAIGYVTNALALIFGIIYMVKGSGKNVATLYKAFLLLVMLGLLVRLIAKFIYPGFGLSAVLMIGSILMLLCLTFAKDLGRTKTLTVFFVLLALDLVAAILALDNRELLGSIASGLSRLVLDGSIGLAIYAKYRDKASRGK